MGVEEDQPAKVDLNKFRKSSALPLSCVNHISRVCSNLTKSKDFYENVLGFVQIKRPGSFDFEGAWLFNYGIGIHLLQDERGVEACQKEIDPKDDHVSFQCEDMTLVEEKLKENRIKYLRREVEEGGIMVDQLFFHDPDCFMIEVCNCDKLPVVPLARAASIKNQEQFFSVRKRSCSLKTALSAASIQDFLPMQSGSSLKHAVSGSNLKHSVSGSNLNRAVSGLSLSEQKQCPSFGIVLDSC